MTCKDKFCMRLFAFTCSPSKAVLGKKPSERERERGSQWVSEGTGSVCVCVCVPLGVREFPIEPPLSLSTLYSLAAAVRWRWLDSFSTAAAAVQTPHTFLFYPPSKVLFHSFLHRNLNSLREKRWQQNCSARTPCFGYGVPATKKRKPPEVGSAHHTHTHKPSAAAGNAHPLLLPLPPPFSEVCGPPRNRKFTFLFFLKKKREKRKRKKKEKERGKKDHAARMCLLRELV